MMALYEVLLIIHSFNRWLVLAACVVTALRAVEGWHQKQPWTALDDRLARGFIASVDVQVLLGISLYFGASPLAHAARANLAAAWTDPVLQFFGVIHPCLALSASVIVHAAWISARRATDARARHRRLALGASLALAAFLGAVPWPFMEYGRALLPSPT